MVQKKENKMAHKEMIKFRKNVEKRKFHSKKEATDMKLLRTCSLVVSDWRSETKGSHFESSR